MAFAQEVQAAIIRRHEGTDGKPEHFEIDPSLIAAGKVLDAMKKEFRGDLVHCYKPKEAQENQPVSFCDQPRAIFATMQYGPALYTIKG